MSDTSTPANLPFGGPAFPTVGNDRIFHGISVRDYFAAKAMQAFLMTQPPHLTDGPPSTWASDAYEFADAMLAERSQ